MIYAKAAELLVLLLMGHFVADYPLQTDFVAKFKCRKASLAAVPWYYVMTGHAATHGLAVALLTGNVWLGTAETAVHWVIDAAKCEGWTSIHVDQVLHFACKAVWAALAVWVGGAAVIYVRAVGVAVFFCLAEGALLGTAAACFARLSNRTPWDCVGVFLLVGALASLAWFGCVVCWATK